jgi:hypothetical protein
LITDSLVGETVERQLTSAWAISLVLAIARTLRPEMRCWTMSSSFMQTAPYRLAHL